MRQHDWRNSPLGSPHAWPSTLRTLVPVILNARLPLCVAWGPQLCLLYNDAYAQILGCGHPGVLGRPLSEIGGDILAASVPHIERALLGEGTCTDILPLTITRNEQQEHSWFSFFYSPLRDEAGAICGVFGGWTESTEQAQAGRRQAFQSELTGLLHGGVDTDATSLDVTGEVPGAVVTARKEAEAALHESEQRFRALFEHHTDAIFSRDLDGNLISANQALPRLTGYTMEELQALPHAAIIAPGQVEQALALFKQAANGCPQNFRNTIIRKDGTAIEVESAFEPILVNDKVVGVYAIVRDMTQAVEYESHIQYLASHDALTGLPNRHLLDDRLHHAIEQRGGGILGILFVDLNRFKMVNDCFGHDKGDLLLKMIARRLKKAVREGDTVARLSGDEFVVVIENVDSIESIAAIADNILEAVAAPFNLGGHELTISSSIGASVFPKDGNDAATLIKHADLAMHQAKELGSSTFRFFNREMNVQMLDRLLTETGLRQALERDELVVHYQTRVDVQNGATIGVEALIRWMHPERGLIPPTEFIPLAEEIGLIGAIGEWVLLTACRQNQAWQDAGLPNVKMSVNLSAYQLNSPSFAGTLQRILDETGLDPKCLELEITESGLMQDFDTSLETLLEIREAGVSISIDDFGTGYSSLSYLKRLPIDTLKIDKSFICDLNHDPDDAAIVAATIALAHNMGLEVVAEGVTNAEQVAFLTDRQCNAMQGFLFSRPLSAKNVERYIRGSAVSESTVHAIQ
ncbi:MAG: hypothetical protein JWQ23_3510 [Herminiimonas sp.]|nr:hypothetical protein [Herminiimonas sp.]